MEIYEYTYIKICHNSIIYISIKADFIVMCSVRNSQDRSLLNCMLCVPCVPTCQKHANISFLRAKDMPFFKLVCQYAKSMPTFHFYMPKMFHFSNWHAKHTKRRANFSTIFQKKECFNYGQHLQISRILGKLQKIYLAKQRI